MSKIAKKANAMRSETKGAERLHLGESVTNFMGGTSYKLNPLDTLRMIAASSIFGEASYYRKDIKDGRYSWESEYSDPFMKANFKALDGKTTTEIFTEAIDNSLSYDFEGTLKLAVELRKNYNMRLNPQVIMVRAALHNKRAEYTAANPGAFAKYEDLVCARADEPATQLAYFLYTNEGKKNGLPTILKTSLAKKLSGLTPYQVNKYKNAEIGMIDAVRLTHAHSDTLTKLMRNELVVSTNETTWETLRSAGKTWGEILSTIKIGHMALLRNLRGIFTEITDAAKRAEILTNLKNGVLEGKQFPFRYYSAYQAIKTADLTDKVQILDALEECMDISVANMPHLKGSTLALSDNSGSAWSAFTSEYGSVTVAKIDNLSAVLVAACSDSGKVVEFGDTTKTFEISKRKGILAQTKLVNADTGADVGRATEGGIWKCLYEAMEKKIKYDNIFIFSDQQAGTGGLYGTGADKALYSKLGYQTNGGMINVFKLIEDYRKKVNPRVSVYSVMTAGYDNMLLPSNAYRTTLLSGWTGKEIIAAAEYNKLWDEFDAKYQFN